MSPGINPQYQEKREREFKEMARPSPNGKPQRSEIAAPGSPTKANISRLSIMPPERRSPAARESSAPLSAVRC